MNKLSPPIQNIEKILLGTLLHSDEARDKFVHYLKTEDFENVQNQIIFQNIQELMQSKRRTFDTEMFIHYLNTKNLMNSAGGMKYISDLIASYVSDEMTESYFNLLLDSSAKRKMKKDLKKLNHFVDKHIDGEDFILQTHKLLTDLESFYRRQSQELIPLSKIVENVLINKEFFKSGKKAITCSTGFVALDKKTHGFQKGELVILAARPSMGKTALALDMALNNLHNPKNISGDTIIFSLEMSPEQLAHRIIIAKSNFFDVKKLTEKDHINMQEFSLKLAKMNIFIDSSTSIDVLTIHSKLREWQKKRQIKLVIIDYLQLLKPLQKTRAETRNLEISNWTRELKETARELKIPILCLSQLSRNVERREDKRPLLSDLRDSGSIEQDADLVMFLFRPNYYLRTEIQKNEKTIENLSDPHVAEIIISKHRNGPIGTIDILFIPTQATFREITD